MIELKLDDCMNIMKKYSDDYFDLAIVDPPYGISTQKIVRRETDTWKKKHLDNIEKHDNWDISPPQKEYFQELFRISKNQIIWGGNYFDLPPTRGIICWDKLQTFPNFSAWEMAWTSFNTVAKIFKYKNQNDKKIHPTQKPIELYDWILDNYAKKGQKILDTHLGSGSIAIACYNFGAHLVGIEINQKYFEDAKNRLNKFKLESITNH